MLNDNQNQPHEEKRNRGLCLVIILILIVIIVIGITLFFILKREVPLVQTQLTLPVIPQVKILSPAQMSRGRFF
jgi:heme/copper-type cytochrome/quinol oxidase subunit 2